MSNPESTQQRQFFRLSYPRSATLDFKTPSGRVLTVINISEYGMCIDADSAPDLELDQAVSGRIFFHNGDSDTLEGQVIRKDEHGIAIKLKKGIKLRDMMQEQLYIKRHYPMHLTAQQD